MGSAPGQAKARAGRQVRQFKLFKSSQDSMAVHKNQWTRGSCRSGENEVFLLSTYPEVIMSYRHVPFLRTQERSIWGVSLKRYSSSLQLLMVSLWTGLKAKRPLETSIITKLTWKTSSGATGTGKACMSCWFVVVFAKSKCYKAVSLHNCVYKKIFFTILTRCKILPSECNSAGEL